MISKPTLLIAEGEAVNLLHIEELLSNDFKILYTNNGEETISKFNENPDISVILVDIKMPGKYDGMEIIKRIKASKRNVPIIAQSAFAKEEEKKKAFDAGCNEFTVKPINNTELLNLILKYVE